MGNVISFLKGLKQQTYEMRKRCLRDKLIGYYNTINQGKVSIPAFMLADADIERCEKENSINKWYKKLIEAR
jgi:hypothetical protein